MVTSPAVLIDVAAAVMAGSTFRGVIAVATVTDVAALNRSVAVKVIESAADADPGTLSVCAYAGSGR